MPNTRHHHSLAPPSTPPSTPPSALPRAPPSKAPISMSTVSRVRRCPLPLPLSAARSTFHEEERERPALTAFRRRRAWPVVAGARGRRRWAAARRAARHQTTRRRTRCSTTRRAMQPCDARLRMRHCCAWETWRSACARSSDRQRTPRVEAAALLSGTGCAGRQDEHVFHGVLHDRSPLVCAGVICWRCRVWGSTRKPLRFPKISHHLPSSARLLRARGYTTEWTHHDTLALSCLVSVRHRPDPDTRQ